MHTDKSQLIPAGTFAAARLHLVGKRLPTFKFLGFTCYWGEARKKGFWRLKYSSRSDRFTAKLNGLREYLWKNMNTKDTDLLLKRITAIVKGWVNYHAISDNDKRVGGFILKSKRLIFRWFKRRGGRRSISWTQLSRVLVQIGFPRKWKVTSMF
jgi:RNA-directed DNA polymerase